MMDIFAPLSTTSTTAPSTAAKKIESSSGDHQLAVSVAARPASRSRSASLKDTIPDPSSHPHTRGTPPPSTRPGRPSSAAGFTLIDPPGQASKSSNYYHSGGGGGGGGGSGSGSGSGSSAGAHYLHQSSASRSPARSPRRARSPQPPTSSSSSSSSSSTPQIPSLPLLPTTIYIPNTPSAADDHGGFTPGGHSSSSNPDYFTSTPRGPPPTSNNSQRPPSRNKADRVLGRSPLGSPPIGVLESEARYRSNAANSRQSHAHPPSAASTREQPPKSAPNGGRERSNSRDQHSRLRSESNASTVLDENYQGTPPRTRERRERDKKTMLSRALQKANTAVLLDNAQNFEGAIEAYGDACKLLQQVMIRSSGEEDRRKLDSIRVTYRTRIEELKRLDAGNQPSGRPLPARPMSNESLDEQRSMLIADADNDEPVVVYETATVQRIINDRPVDDDIADSHPSHQLPFRQNTTGGARESVISTAIREVQKSIPNTSFLLQAPPGRIGAGSPLPGTMGLESPMDRSYMPPPLSPRRPLSPSPPMKQEPEHTMPNTLQPLSDRPYQSVHRRGNSSESTSWLDTIDESGGSSCSSSVHSLSMGGLRRKHIRSASGETEAEFDAALDAAVEAAYDDGYEPYDEDTPNTAELIAERLKNVELAKERVREAERDDAIAAAKNRYRESQMRPQGLQEAQALEPSFQNEDEEEEEERLLEEMTKEYMLDGFDFDLQTKSALPRQSDSSGSSSGRTYNSSVSSHRTTGGTSLSTVAEVLHPTKQKAPQHSPPPIPASSSTLPSVSENTAPVLDDTSETTPTTASVTKEASSVRSRRLSGQNLRTLKIETSLPSVPSGPHTDKPNLPEKDARPDVPPLPKTAATATFNTSQNPTDSNFKVPALPPINPQAGLTAPSPQPHLPSPSDTTFTVSPATPALGQTMSNDIAPPSPKTAKGQTLGIRKNKSSLSLKQRTLSLSSPDGSDGSIGTPLSTTFSFTGVRKQSSVTAPTPTPSVPTFNVDGLPSGGMHLFESDIHSPYSPGSPNNVVTNAPIPLEPCPDSYLLRPFWLMRCFYQTIAHPRGGYLSTKLFVPRDVWRVKGVKLKNIDDKIANCDLLTAALQRLATVDTLDADAVLEEMQALEVVLDQVQTTLSKKLGNEVGVHGVSTLFKDASTVGVDSNTHASSEKGSHGSQDHSQKSSAMAQGKSYLASWRKLRSKNSAVGLSSMVSKTGTSNEVPKDSLTMATLPMTSLPNIRFAKRDIGSVVFEGPNSGYMGSLARLFDAVQILDQIARQVEDPGLKHSSPTHVGLELSARHAAEFFGFYICRFVLSDVTLMLDKFIKRGSEWVLV